MNNLVYVTPTNLRLWKAMAVVGFIAIAFFAGLSYTQFNDIRNYREVMEISTVRLATCKEELGSVKVQLAQSELARTNAIIPEATFQEFAKNRIVEPTKSAWTTGVDYMKSVWQAAIGN